MSENIRERNATEIDPFTVEIVRARLESIGQEMGTTIIRTSGSPANTESKDFSCGLYDFRGRQLTFGSYVLIHMGSTQEGINCLLREYSLDEIEPGDVFVANDPVRGGGIHPMDICVIKPHFYEGELVSWSGVAAHMLDFGGMSPGGFVPTATDCYQEALLLPPVKLMRRGKIDKAVWNIIMNNVRINHRVGLDLKCLISANVVAEERILKTVAQYGVERFKAIQQVLQELSEKAMRKRISQIADGEYIAADWLESNGRRSDVFKVECRLIVKGDEMTLDFSGTDPQTDGFINCGFGGVIGGAYTIILQMIGWDIPINDGFMKPIHLAAPEGILCHAQKPFPVGAGHQGACFKVMETTMACLDKALASTEGPLGQRTMSNWGNCWPLTVFHGLNQYGDYDVWINMDSGGAGGAARSTMDGLSNSGTVTNCDNSLPDVEWNEQLYPMLYLHRSFYKDSGGPGRYRGGLGMQEAWVLHDTEEQGSTVSEQRREVPPSGMFGGLPSSASKFIVKHNTDIDDWIGLRQELPVDIKDIKGDEKILPIHYMGEILRKGDVFYYDISGGGGFQDPLLREPEMVLKDVTDGLVSFEQARNAYGVVIDPEIYQLNLAETEQQRQRIRKERLERASRGRTDEPSLASESEIVSNLGPSLIVAQREGQRRIGCRHCRVLLCSLEENWKERVPLAESDMGGEHVASLGLWVQKRSNPRILLREFVCPNCGTLLDAQVAVEGMPIIRDSKPDSLSK